MYNPNQLYQEYDLLEHGKARTEGIRNAIQEADQHNDLPYRFFFRLELCKESIFYGDALDMMVVFPELLALADQYPDTPATVHNNLFDNSLDHVLWVYKWLIDSCCEFYQVSREDCLSFFEDFKKRSLAYGYNLRPYYQNLRYFYKPIDAEYAKECFHKFEELPHDGNCNCAACERNTEVSFYLENGNFDKARELSRDIESFKLYCGNGRDKAAWLRNKTEFLHYYKDRGEFDKASELCSLIERNKNQLSEFDIWDVSIYCHAHADIGKALRLYKKHWKDVYKSRCPQDNFYANSYVSSFFRELGKERKGDTIKLQLDASFPLYREDHCYKISELYQYYYQAACEVADRFDKRNGTDYYRKKLEEIVQRSKAAAG